jgi:predicted GIY-YIG superfamily endonuclease
MQRLESSITFYVYILECADGSYYVGLARNGLYNRIDEHNAGKYRGYTFSRRPVKLVWSQDFSRLTQAIGIERQLKGWRREKKKALIDGRYDLLPQLSRTAKPHPSTSSG